jgi:hypothetical protein
MKIVFAIESLLLLSLVSCLGGGSGGSSGGGSGGTSDLPTGNAGTLTGTAAIGAPMANAKVKVRGKGLTTACEKVTETNASGYYSVALAECTGPFIISAESSAGKVYSVATDEDVGKIVNVTPLTQVVASRVFEETNLDSIDISLVTITKTKIDTQTAIISNLISEIAKEFGAEAVDIRSGAFKADGSGIDKLLDMISVQPGDISTAIGIKGTSVTISVPEDLSSQLPTPISSAQADQASSSASEFQTMKDLLTGITGINACLKNKNQSCFEGFFHDQYKSNGQSASDMWDDLFWDGMEASYGNLVLVSMNDTKDEAWVAYVLKEKDQDSGEVNNWLDIEKMKKVDGAWKIYGNQIPWQFRPQAGLISFGDGVVKKGLNIRIFDNEQVPDEFKFLLKSDDIGISAGSEVEFTNSNIGGWEYFTASDHKPACETYNNDCKSFMIQQSDISPMFVKLNLSYDDGITWNDVYVTSTQDIPKPTDKVPEFEDLAYNTDLCRTVDVANPFPVALQSLSWTLPDGFSTEGTSSSMTGTFDSWWLNDGTIATNAISVPFGSVIQASGDYDITSIQLRLELRDSLDRAYFLIYGCASP